MILRLRRRHRVAAALLAAVLPLLVLLAMRARRPAPTMERIPEAAAAEGTGR